MITLSEDQLRATRENYPQRMADERARQEAAIAEREGHARALELFKGPSAKCRSTYDANDQLAPPLLTLFAVPVQAAPLAASKSQPRRSCVVRG